MLYRKQQSNLKFLNFTYDCLQQTKSIMIKVDSKFLSKYLTFIYLPINFFFLHIESGN